MQLIGTPLIVLRIHWLEFHGEEACSHQERQYDINILKNVTSEWQTVRSTRRRIMTDTPQSPNGQASDMQMI